MSVAPVLNRSALPFPGAPLTPVLRERQTTLVGTHRPLPFTWAGRACQFHFVPKADAAVALATLRLRLAEHPLELGFAAVPEPARLGLPFAGIEAALLPPDLIAAVLEACLEEPRAALERQGVILAVEAWSSAAPATPAWCGWEIRTEADTTFYAGTLHAAPAAIDALAGLVQRRAPTARPLPAAFSVPLTLRLARVFLAPTALRALSAGDVLLLPLTAAERRSGRCDVWTGERRLAQVRRTPTALEFLTMTSPTDSKSGPAAVKPLAVDELPVPLDFDLGQAEVTLAQLRTFAPGHTFELPSSPEQLVTLRVHGREVGYGELVDLGDKAGVRIVSWHLA